MITFDRVEFEKSISISVKKKATIQSKWEIKRLADILASLESGKRPKGGVGEYQSGIPSLGGEHIKLDGTVSTNNMKFVPEAFFNNSKQGILHDLDILICKDGALTGKTSLFKKNLFLFEKGMVNEHVFILRVNNACRQKYIFYLLYSIQGQEILKLNVTGSAQGGLNRENLLNICLPVPPIDIQDKIVSEIEILETKELTFSLEINNFKDERDILIVNASNSLFKLKEITSKIGSGATPDGGDSSYIQKGISLIRSQNVYDNEFYKEGLAFIDDNQAKKLNNVTVEANDILINITGASVARCCIVDKAYLPARVNQHVAIIRTNEKALPKYVQQILVSTKYKSELLSLSESSSTREAITKSQLEDFRIPLPPLSEQQKIVNEIEALEDKIANLEAELATIPHKKELILKKYL